MVQDGVPGREGGHLHPTEFSATHGNDETVLRFRSNSNRAGTGFRLKWQCSSSTTDVLSQSYTVGEDMSLTQATPGAIAWQCFAPYHAYRTEAWRMRSADPIPDGVYFSDGEMVYRLGDGFSEQHTVWLGHSMHRVDPPISGRWVRLAGEGGDVLETTPGDGHHGSCGSWEAYWASGWAPADGVPPQDYATPGTLPSTSDGVKSMTVRLQLPAPICMHTHRIGVSTRSASASCFVMVPLCTGRCVRTTMVARATCLRYYAFVLGGFVFTFNQTSISSVAD